jgi:hypothetical protein
VTTTPPRPPGWPHTDRDTAELITQTIHTLTIRRWTCHDTDSCAAISSLTSLIRDAQQRLPDLVRHARRMGHTWTEIACRLGTTTTQAAATYPDQPTHPTPPHPNNPTNPNHRQ